MRQMRVTIEEDRILLASYPFRPATVFHGGAVDRDSIEAILPQRLLPEVRLRSGEVLFVQGESSEATATLRRELEAFAVRVAIPTRSKVPSVWGMLADEFLDTEHDFHDREIVLDRLAERGLDRPTARVIRRRIAARMYFLTFLTWEWALYDHWDVLCAMRTFTTRRRFAEFYRFSMEVARHDFLPPDPSVPGLVVEPARSRLEARW